MKASSDYDATAVSFFAGSNARSMARRSSDAASDWRFPPPTQQAVAVIAADLIDEDNDASPVVQLIKKVQPQGRLAGGTQDCISARIRSTLTEKLCV